MTKAILIIDLPMMCAECPMFTWASKDNYSDGFCTHSHKLVKFDLRPLDCPLKPMPQKGDFEIADDHPFTKAEIMAYTYGITVGRNQVIEEITE